MQIGSATDPPVCFYRPCVPRAIEARDPACTTRSPKVYDRGPIAFSRYLEKHNREDRVDLSTSALAALPLVQPFPPPPPESVFAKADLRSVAAMESNGVYADARTRRAPRLWQAYEPWLGAPGAKRIDVIG